MGGDGDLPLHPLLAGSPAVDGALGDTSPDEQRDDWIDDFDPATPARLDDVRSARRRRRRRHGGPRPRRHTSETIAGRRSCWPCARKAPSAHTVVTIPGGYDRGAGTTYAATSATNEFVTYALPIAETGRYDVIGRRAPDPDAGKFQIAIADDPAGPWTPLGAEQDGYASTAAFAPLGPFPTPSSRRPARSWCASR